MDCYSAPKQKEILTPATRMNLEDIMLSEISQSQKDKYSMIPLIEVFQVAKHLAESRTVVARAGSR